MRSIFSFAAVFIVLLCTLVFWYWIQKTEVNRSKTIFAQVNSVLKENSDALEKEEKLYNDTSLANARMVAYILQYHPEARENVEELEKICENLEIDEIHIFNEKCVIIQGTQPEYYGYSFDSGEQMAFFKPLLTDQSLELVQEITENTAAGKLEQYSALWSEDGSFIVEVGNHPQRVLDSYDKNQLPYIFHIVGAGSDSSLYALDLNEDTVTASTNTKVDEGTQLKDIGIAKASILSDGEGFFARVNGTMSYCVSEVTEEYTLVRTVTAATMFRTLLLTEIFLIAAILEIFLLLNNAVIRTVDQRVVKPIRKINKELDRVSAGDYTTRIESQPTRELEELGQYTNNMIASIEEHVSTVHYQSRHDLLTGVWNRNALQLKLARLRTMDAMAGIMYADLNGLKRINDELGHEFGDRAIAALAEILTDVFGKANVYRAGGDEFVVVDETLSEEKLAKRFDAFRTAAAEHSVSVSAGISYCRDTQQIDQKMMEADAEMYRTKKSFYQANPDASGRKSELNSVLVQKNSSASEDQPVWLQRLQEMYKAFSLLSTDGYTYLCDLDHDYSIWSGNAVETFALPDTHMEHASELWEALIHPEDRRAYHESIEKVFSGEADSHDLEYRVRERNGRYDVCTCRGIVLKDENGVPHYFGGVIRNHALADRIDPLTGLMNRECFFEGLRGLIRSRQEAEITMFGLSGFSEINSLYGYEFGNRVLQKIAVYARTLFAELGDYYLLDGTQTILVTHQLPVTILEEKFREFRNWLFEDLELDGNRISIRLNGAMMSLNQFDIDDNTVFVCLNTAYQRAKHDSQGELIHLNDADESRDTLRVINDVRQSLGRGYEGFEMFYQPVVDAEGEKLSGAEALIRWSNDEFGYVPPDRFIPVLENDTRFYMLGLWIIRQSLLDGLAMVKKIPGFLLHVNLSYTQIENANFEHDIIGILKDTGYPAENLVLEITERCRLVDQARLRNFIIRLRSYGIRFALDDFGTGYASATALRMFDIDIIKVDKSFIQKIETDEKEQRFLKNLINLARICDAETCVEGVETEGMCTEVKACGADVLQGYYYAKPMQIADFRTKYEI